MTMQPFVSTPENEIRRRFKRLAISLSDLTSAAAFASAIDSASLYSQPHAEHNRVLIGLTTALVVSYSRPFSKNNPGSTFAATRSLSDAFVAKYLPNQDERDIHDKVLTLRDRQFAHSDADVFNINIALHAGGARWRHDFVTTPLPRAEFDALRRAIDNLTIGIHKEQDELAKQLPANDTF